MELDISGARIFFTLPIDVPVLGPLRISETMVDCYDTHNRFVYLADT